MEFKELCEEIYKDWEEKSDAFCDFKNFQTEFMAETYYWTPGKNDVSSECMSDKILYILNNNPGDGLPCQTKEEIKREFGDESYAKISEQFYKYLQKDKTFNGTPKTRLNKMQDFAKELNFDCIEDVEIFFLHSKSFNKNKFLKKYKNHPLVTKYTQALTEYLKDKPVLSINGFDPKKTITKENVRQSEWIQYVAGIIGFDFNNAKEIPITHKGDKTTSMAFVFGNKIMFFTMGTNNITNISCEKYEEIKNCLGIK